VILLRRPDPELIAAYREARLGVPPPCPSGDGTPPPGFRHDRWSREIGAGKGSFERARAGLRQWAAHRGSGVDVHPEDAEVVAGGTVAVVTRQLGLWVLAACRIEDVVDEPGRFGFTYAALPDHPACGYESFLVGQEGDTVRFDVDAVSRPGVRLVRVAAPVARLLQRRASAAYLASLQRWTSGGN
jgi:uncharacterized protein (UPF0548 family)